MTPHGVDMREMRVSVQPIITYIYTEKDRKKGKGQIIKEPDNPCKLTKRWNTCILLNFNSFICKCLQTNRYIFKDSRSFKELTQRCGDGKRKCVNVTLLQICSSDVEIGQTAYYTSST